LNTNTLTSKRTASILALAIIIIAFLCLIWILYNSKIATSHQDVDHCQITAHIYQDGVLLKSIDLNAVTESYRFTVTGQNNCRNEIEVRPGSIGILSADCPDKLCVHQGFIDSSLLPITCLPNRLVIQIKSEEITTDIVTY